MAIVVGLTVLGFSAAVLIFVLLAQIVNQRLFLKTLQLRLLSVRLSKKEKPEKESLLSEVKISGQLLQILSGLKIPVALEVAMHNVGEAINFYIAVPATAVSFVKKQVHSFWPDAKVEETEDYTIFNPEGAVDAVYLKQKKSYALPIRVYSEAGVDTFSPIVGHFSQLEAVGDGLAIQVLLKPAPSSVKKSIAQFINNLKKPKEGEKQTIIGAEETENIRAAEQKLAKPIFAVNYRIVASAATPSRAQGITDGLLEAFTQFSDPVRNELKAVRPKNPKDLIFQYVFRKFENDQTMVLGIDELVSMFHFPTSETEVPRILWARAKEAEPPLNLPKTGVVVGESVFRSDKKIVKIDDEDRRRHVYVVGQTGTGKSNLLINMAEADIRLGKGVCVMDPHGDLIDAVLGLIPADRYQDVVVFEPSDLNHPIGLNMLEYNPAKPEEKTFIVNELQSIFNRLFEKETMGPMFEQYMRNALLLLMDDPVNQATLMEVPRVFTDPEFRKGLLAKAKNPSVADFWEKEAVKAGGEASLANITPYITSKFSNFIANDYVRPIIGQPKSSFNFRELMDRGKILLVNLSKGKIGEINANLLGMIIVGKILMAALSRTDVSEKQRRDFHLYIDEFQNFTTDSIAVILSEARKYRLNLVVAHQFIAQLEEKIREAVFGNVGSFVAFRVGANDADYLEKHFAPVFGKEDLMNMDNFTAYARLLINGQVSKPFNIRTLPARFGEEEAKHRLREFSRSKYGGNREQVETEILTRLRK